MLYCNRYSSIFHCTRFFYPPYIYWQTWEGNDEECLNAAIQIPRAIHQRLRLLITTCSRRCGHPDFHTHNSLDLICEDFQLLAFVRAQSVE